jgi:hypothetical protein
VLLELPKERTLATVGAVLLYTRLPSGSSRRGFIEKSRGLFTDAKYPDDIGSNDELPSISVGPGCAPNIGLIFLERSQGYLDWGRRLGRSVDSHLCHRNVKGKNDRLTFEKRLRRIARGALESGKGRQLQVEERRQCILGKDLETARGVRALLRGEVPRAHGARPCAVL